MRLSVLFYIWKYRINSRGEAPIMCRVTYNKRRLQFSTGIFTSPYTWNAKKQKVNERSRSIEPPNLQLHSIRESIYRIYYNQVMNGKLVSVYTVVHEFRGKDEVPKRLLEVFDEFLSRRKKLEGKDFSYSTLCKLSQARQHTGNVLKSKGVSDLDLSQLKITFLHDFIHVLRSNEYATSTINRAIRDLKQVIKYAISRGYLDKDPFVGYRLKHEKKPINYLTGEELQSIVNWVPVSDKLSNVRDCFVFSCYSGLDYSSSKALRLHHINTLPDGTRWIEMVRQKTNKSIRVPLLPEAEKIVDKYIIAPESKLPLYSNQKFNVYLKEIGAALGIRTKLTHHLARKTFATTVLLSRGVPIEVVKELLGHSDIATTMSSYATVNRGLIMDHLNKLR